MILYNLGTDKCYVSARGKAIIWDNMVYMYRHTYAIIVCTVADL